MARLLKIEILDLSLTVDSEPHLYVEVGNLLQIMATYDASYVMVEIVEDEGVELQSLDGEAFGFLPLRRAS